MYGTGLKEFATPVVRNLIIINVVIFIASNIIPGLNTLFTDWFALHPLYGKDFKVWQFISYMFLHANIMHIFGNMFALYMFGSWLEKMWGGKRFLFFYFFTGIGAALLYWSVLSLQLYNFQKDIELFDQSPSPELAIRIMRDHVPAAYDQVVNDLNRFQDHPENQAIVQEFSNAFHYLFNMIANIPTLGASGAVFGILMAFGMLFPNTELRLLFPPIPIKAKYFVLLYGLLELYLQFQNSPTDNVAHLAHLSGMLFAFILVKYWSKQRNSFY